MFPDPTAEWSPFPSKAPDRIAIFPVCFALLDNTIVRRFFENGPVALRIEHLGLDRPSPSRESEVVRDELGFAFLLSRLGGSDIYVEAERGAFALRQHQNGFGWFAIGEAHLTASVVNGLRFETEKLLSGLYEGGFSAEEVEEISTKLGLPVSRPGP